MIKVRLGNEIYDIGDERENIKLFIHACKVEIKDGYKTVPCLTGDDKCRAAAYKEPALFKNGVKIAWFNRDHISRIGFDRKIDKELKGLLIKEVRGFTA